MIAPHQRSRRCVLRAEVPGCFAITRGPPGAGRRRPLGGDRRRSAARSCREPERVAALGPRGRIRAVMLLSCVSAGMAANRDILPDPADPRLLELGLSAWNAALAEAEDANRAAPAHIAQARIAQARAWSGTPEGERLLAALFGNCPFLGGVAVAEWDFLTRLIDEGADAPFRGNSRRDRAPGRQRRGSRFADALAAPRAAPRRAARGGRRTGRKLVARNPDGGAEPLCRRRDRRRAAPSFARARHKRRDFPGRSGRSGTGQRPVRARSRQARRPGA